MTGKDAFNIWAPTGAPWVDWARPVPFVSINDSHDPDTALSSLMPSIAYLAEPRENMAVIIDLPGSDSVKEGIALARMGFRPIPLYNGTSRQEGAMALVDSRLIETALVWGAFQLEAITIPPNAPPAFLLDSNRTHQYKMDGSVFDNSWDIYHQDLPPAESFLRSGINQILVRGEAIQKDLRKILYPFQKKGIDIFFTNGYAPPQKVVIKSSPVKGKWPLARRIFRI